MSITKLEGKCVVISGAGAGIGLATAIAFARAGAKLVVTDIAEESLARLRADLDSLGMACLAQVCDVSSPDSVADLAREVGAQFGAADVLVNNAGIGYLGDFLHTPPDAWTRVIGVNLMGVIHMTRAFLPGMIEAGGPRAVVNVASALGFTPGPALSAYSASKHAVVGLSEALGMELAQTQVRVSIIAPGVIDTEIVKSKTAMASNISDEQIEGIQRHYREKGSSPESVAADIVKAVRTERRIVPTGRMALPMTVLPRISRRLMRIAAISGGRDIGYWRAP